jgi:predicted neutral ceramidase superfamily lipid hydrolase
MSAQDQGRAVTNAIASTSSADINRLVDAANSSKEKRRELAEIKAKAKAKLEAEQKANEEAAVRVSSPQAGWK